jgi:porphobilinogen deaminase
MGAAARRVSSSELELTGWVGLPDGSEWIQDVLVGAPESVASELAARMISVGARELLERAEQEVTA